MEMLDAPFAVQATLLAKENDALRAENERLKIRVKELEEGLREIERWSNAHLGWFINNESYYMVNVKFGQIARGLLEGENGL
jgi:cell division protein FtsB